jgi:hypothetical protein
MNKWIASAALSMLSVALPLSAQTAPTKTMSDPFASLSFLLGTWEARTVNNPAVTASGAYTFRAELSGHILARHTMVGGCKGPDDFNCQHGDLLYIYTDGPDQPLRAIYFDNEGHVIHFGVTAPTPTSAEFLSDRDRPGPQFRLFYELKEHAMSGKFQIRMPGQQDWKSYLEWAGSRKP